MSEDRKLTPAEQQIMQDALRASVVIVRKGKRK